MKLIRLSKFTGKDHSLPDFYYINADNITFFEQSQSCANIYFSDITTTHIQVKESAQEISDMIEKLK